MNFTNIKNIIFDLGNVVIDINPSKTYKAFSRISNSKKSDEIESIIKSKNLWLGYEAGQFTDEEFRDSLRLNLDLEADDIAIDTAFNALLLDVDGNRLNLIEHLSKQYRVFVLSNTSKIHMIEFEKIVKKCTNRTNFWNVFEKPYFSYEMGKLKPNLDIYQQVIEESKLIAQETLFIDDLKPNVEAANSLNIHTIHLEKPFTILNHPILQNLVKE